MRVCVRGGGLRKGVYRRIDEETTTKSLRLGGGWGFGNEVFE